MDILQPGPRLVGYRLATIDLQKAGWLQTIAGHSVNGGTTHLQPGKMVAHCAAGHAEDSWVYVPTGFGRDDLMSQHGPTPSRHCGCGFYAFASMAELLADPHHGSVAEPQVVCAVLAWGRIILAQYGFVSEFQQIVGVARWRHDPVNDALIEKIGRIYSMPGFGGRQGPALLALMAYTEGLPGVVTTEEIEDRYRRDDPVLETKTVYQPPSPAPARTRATAKPRKPSTRGAPKMCECECGLMTRGGRFVPGHDAKLKSRLRHDWRMGVTHQIRQDARARLDALGW